MRKIRMWSGLAAVLAAALAACGGGGSSNSVNVRLINATLTHSSLALLSNSNATIGATATDTVSGYSGVDSGSPTLQLNDSVSGTVLATTAPSLSQDQHYAVLAYESGGTVRTTVISEDIAAPAANTAVLRVFDAATDAGAVDVYVTAPGVDISTLSSPTFTFASSTSPLPGTFLSFAPGTYRVQVTGAGNVSDLRLDIPSIALASQELATVILTPTSGGTLANGSVLIQQGAYSATRNTNARVRLVADVAGGGVVTACAPDCATASKTIGQGMVSPSVGSYVVVPATSAITVSVGGAPVASPSTALTAGADTTLAVYGSVGTNGVLTTTASLINDDNHLPTTTSNFKIRLYNGLTSSTAAAASQPTPLSMSVNFAQVAASIAAGSASSYAAATASIATRVDVNSNVGTIYSESALNVQGNAVYTLFMLGDTAAPVHLLRKDH